jgi:polygalacturonase
MQAQNQAPAPVACVVNGVPQVVAAANDRTIDTTNIQGAIDACTTVGAQAAKTVFVQLQPGNYIIKPITMKSWVYLLMPAGVVLNASTVTADYQQAGSGTCGGIASSSSGCKPLISSAIGSDPEANNIGIIGSRAVGIMGGTIEGHGWDATVGGPNSPSSWWAIADTANGQGKKQICPRLIEFDKGTNILLRDITIQNSPYFHVVLSQSTQVTAMHLTIQSPTPNHPSTARNTDGIDPISSTFVSITNNHIVSGDDNIAITAAGKGASHDITIQNNYFGAGHGLSIGSGTNSTVYNVYAKYIYFNGTDNGVRLKSDSSAGGEVSHLFYDTLCMKAINTGSKSSKNGAITLDTEYSSSTGTLYPYYHDIHFHDVWSDTASATISGKVWDQVRIDGKDSQASQPISNVSFYNVIFTAPKTASPVINVDTGSIYLYQNSLNLSIPGVTALTAPPIDPYFNEGPNANIAQYCQQYNK